jgi:hypothetical protein
MKLFAFSMMAALATASGTGGYGDYGGNNNKGVESYGHGGGVGGGGKKGNKCRQVEQEKPVCKDKHRKVHKKYDFKGYKQKCHFEKVPHDKKIKIDVKSDTCKPHIVTKKNKRPVHINNKKCEYKKDKKGTKTPVCKIVKETRWVESYDKVTKWKCGPQKDHKTVHHKFYTHKEVCKPHGENEKQSVDIDVTERVCHVEKYYRTVCDDDKGGYTYQDGKGDHDYSKYGKPHVRVSVSNKGGYHGGYGSDGGHKKDSGYGSYGDDSGHKKDSGYGDYGGYGDDGGHKKESGYGDDGGHKKDSGYSDYGGYGDDDGHKKDSGYGGYGDDGGYGGYGDDGSHKKDSGYGGYGDDGGHKKDSGYGGYGDDGGHKKDSSYGGYGDDDGHKKDSGYGGYGDDGGHKKDGGYGDYGV